MPVCRHVERPQIFALLHWREIEECWLTLSLRGGRLLFVLCMSLFEIDWPPPPPKPRGLGSRGGGPWKVIFTAPFVFTTVLNAGESSNPTEFRTAVNTFEGIY